MSSFPLWLRPLLDSPDDVEQWAKSPRKRRNRLFYVSYGLSERLYSLCECHSAPKLGGSYRKVVTSSSLRENALRSMRYPSSRKRRVSTSLCCLWCFRQIRSTYQPQCLLDQGVGFASEIVPDKSPLVTLRRYDLATS